MVAGGVSTRGLDPLAHVTEAELRQQYEAYCRRQASRLVYLMPREAVRPLYRRARDEARKTDALADSEASDPLELLLRYCRRLLPLPTFEVWREDLRRYPDQHFADLEESADAPTADAPSTMGVRTLRVHGRSWLARLRSFREAGAWRGYIAFEEEGSGRAHRTAAVFCEPSADELRERFLSFEEATLEAFLRSALP